MHPLNAHHRQNTEPKYSQHAINSIPTLIDIFSGGGRRRSRHRLGGLKIGLF